MTPRNFGALIEDIFNNGLNRVWNEDSLTDRSDVPVNIRETDKSYELELIAPGLKKEEFKINIDKSILTLSFEHKEEEKAQTEKLLRTEYKRRSFKRSFTLNDKVDASQISARYTDGVLYVTLPKKEQHEVTSQEINVQ
jgi:HSP20 family protein